MIDGTPPPEFEYLFARNPEIVKYPNDVLRTIAASVENVDSDIKKIIKKMRDILLSTSGIGLAAPQIGVSKRIIYVDSRVIVNPEIVHIGRLNTISQEGCLSVPGLWGEVLRSSEIKLTGLNHKGENLILNLIGREAIIAQHEIDHLDGIMFFDKANPSSLRWEHP